jgi:hypothetical protein
LNTERVCKCTASLSKTDERADLWKYILGTEKLEVPLRHPLYISNPNFPGKLFLEGDASKLSDEQKARLIERMSEKFKLSKKEVAASLEGKDSIVPILSDGCVTSVCEWHMRQMID